MIKALLKIIPTFLCFIILYYGIDSIRFFFITKVKGHWAHDNTDLVLGLIVTLLGIISIIGVWL